MAFEPNKAHLPSRQYMSICHSETACKMIAKLVIRARRRKPTDKHPSVLHYECLQLQSLGECRCKKFSRIFFSSLVCAEGGKKTPVGTFEHPAIVAWQKAVSQWLDAPHRAATPIRTSSCHPDDIPALIPTELLRNRPQPWPPRRRIRWRVSIPKSS